MKLSVSLPEADVAFLDSETSSGRFESRSAAIHAAVRYLHDRQYTDSYAAAWDEWDESGDSQVWEAVAGDGIR
jgi:putative addiction module CopG family antidote